MGGVKYDSEAVKASSFSYQFEKQGEWSVTYTSPKTGRQWTTLITDVELIALTRNCDQPKKRHLVELRMLVRKG